MLFIIWLMVLIQVLRRPPFRHLASMLRKTSGALFAGAMSRQVCLILRRVDHGNQLIF